MHELPAGVTVFERGWLSSNSILFEGASQTALVDSGYCTHAGQTLALIQHALGARPLELLLSTHLHSDHCGGNAAVQAAHPKVETRIPPGQAEQVRNWDQFALSYVSIGQQCPRFRINGVLAPGAGVMLGDFRWEIHASPGHDPHSVVLFEPKTRTLISADALWENGFGVVFQELEGEEAFNDVARTLDVIETLDPKIVVPGHGQVFTHVEQSLAAARRRLDGFVRDPGKHAAHAAKVLLKFKLLESQTLRLTECIEWTKTTAYFNLLHKKWVAGLSLQEWTELLADSLVRSGAARREGDYIINT